jgi:hypothetical protein
VQLDDRLTRQIGGEHLAHPRRPFAVDQTKVVVRVGPDTLEDLGPRRREHFRGDVEVPAGAAHASDDTDQYQTADARKAERLAHLTPDLPDWSSHDSVEALPTGSMSRFEWLGAEPSEVAVTSHSIVEGIDVVGHIGGRERSVLVDLFLDGAFFRLLKNDSATAFSQQFPFRLMLGSR